MRSLYSILIFMLAIVMLQACANDFGAALNEVVKSSTSWETGTDSKEASSTNTAKSESKPAFNLLSPSRQEEIQIGRQITGNLLGAAPLVNDEELQNYVNKVGRWVANQGERADLPWHFGVIESEDINAFAAPGGYVVITKGLYRKMENEAQLAGVLSHEIAHVIRSHHLKILQKTQLLNFGSDLLGKQLGRDNQVIQKLIGSGAEVCARSLDKSAEFEADRMGVVLTTRAGYEPFGLPEVLQIIGQTGRDESRVALLFKTHPLPDDRLVKLDDAIGNRLDSIKDGKTLGERFYRLRN